MVFEPVIEQFVEIAIVTSLSLVVEDTLVFAFKEFLAIRHYCAEQILQRTMPFYLHETPVPFCFEIEMR